MNEFKETIEKADNETLNALYIVFNETCNELPGGSPARDTFIICLTAIKNELKKRGTGISGNVSKSDKVRALEYLGEHGISLDSISNSSNSQRRENNSPFHNFIVGTLGLLGFIVVVIVFAILKEVVTGLGALWASGVLPIILGITAIGGGLIYGAKHGWFKKLKNFFIEEETTSKANTKSNTVSKQNTVTNTDKKTVEEKPKTKESKVTLSDRFASFVAALMIGTTGVALVNHNTEIFDNNGKIKRYTDGVEGFYNSIIRSVRVAFHDTFNNYKVYKDLGYMDDVDYKKEYENQKTVIRDTSLDALHVIYRDGETWEEISYAYFGTTEYAHQLQLYNGYFDIPSKPLKKKDMVFIPTRENLEVHINYRK